MKLQNWKNKIWLLLVASLTLSFTSCEKDSSDETSKYTPVELTNENTFYLDNFWLGQKTSWQNGEDVVVNNPTRVFGAACFDISHTTIDPSKGYFNIDGRASGENIVNMTVRTSHPLDTKYNTSGCEIFFLQRANVDGRIESARGKYVGYVPEENLGITAIDFKMRELKNSNQFYDGRMQVQPEGLVVNVTDYVDWQYNTDFNARLFIEYYLLLKETAEDLTMQVYNNITQSYVPVAIDPEDTTSEKQFQDIIDNPENDSLIFSYIKKNLVITELNGTYHNLENNTQSAISLTR